MLIPFSPPYISEEACESVLAVMRSGWITTGKKVQELEQLIADFTQTKRVFCVNSATGGMEMVLRWWGIGAGDEVIVPAYTYCATANVVLHCGATPVMVDIKPDDFTICAEALSKLITPRTKAVIAVDIGGMPCDYAEILAALEANKAVFSPDNDKQAMLGRPLLMADAAHSLGASYRAKPAVLATDVSVYSFHAVKNLTTAEGGAIAWSLPEDFELEELYNWCRRFALHGQSKDAFAKFATASWEYDVFEAGYKYNMPDILAAIGCVGMQDYAQVLKKRKHIFDTYTAFFSQFPEQFEPPVYETAEKTSAYHLYLLKLKNATPAGRNQLIDKLFEKGISTNVHYKPLPLLSVYKGLGYKMGDYPVAQKLFEQEITLPVFYTMTAEQLAYVVEGFKEACL